MKNVLFVKIGALGDLSYALPAAKALKESLACRLTWVVGKTYQSFIAGHEYIDELIVIDDKRLYSKNWLGRFFELFRLAVKARRRFDLVIIAHRDPLYYFIFNAFSRGKTFQMVRDETKDPAFFIPIPPKKMHESLAIKKLTEAAVRYADPSKQSVIWEWDYSHIAANKRDLPESYIVIHLGGGLNAKTEFRLKCWPHWEKLVLRLLAETKLNLVFVGSLAEEINFKAIEEKIMELYPEKLNRCYNMMNDVSIRELTDMIETCDLFAGVDSGPLHIADSMNKPVIGLFGPTSSVSWGLLSPSGTVFQQSVPCSPCYKDDGIFPECHYNHRCMTSLEVEPVFLKILELLNSVGDQ